MGAIDKGQTIGAVGHPVQMGNLDSNRDSELFWFLV